MPRGPRFAGKTVIVTGSSSGMGKEMALNFASEGAAVVVHGQRDERLREVKEALKDLGIPDKKYLVVKGPIQEAETQDKLVNETLKKFGQIDVLINNAGVSHLTGSDPNSVESMDYVYNVNFRSVYTLTDKILPHLIKTKGNVVNISSVGSQRVSERVLPYTALKAALDHLTRGLALVNAQYDVRINTVSPGGIHTEFLTRHGMTQEAGRQAEEYYADRVIPLRRYGHPKELANMVLFLASDEASYITGANMIVDGGVLAGVPSKTWEPKIQQRAVK
ncbi:unnamed protein product [Bursaphelenchus xylophilus]|uniref:(pine wood nematode) hypothetical protein n=1 Tax=Bursaphelenchus xylophilus TaxID=6326 RepID=A0A1I7SLH1_BURXY|nr:unnamed protein product [Bursaphelenchus xylophilus]CAG9129591.1 unnamed protein product [Bursaphelenchus xylophilus]